MPRPWGKLDVGWINHPKFLALSGNAICLWQEVKNYCDEHLTDGIIPLTAVRRLRFYSPVNLDALLRSAGPKPNGDPRRPLLERFDIGGVRHFRMRKYLEYNRCREAVLANIAKAETEKARKRANQQAWRDRHKVGQQPSTSPVTLPVMESVTREERSAALPDRQRQSTDPDPSVAKEQQQKGTPRKERPIYQGRKFSLHRWQRERLSQLLAPAIQEHELDDWIRDLDEEAHRLGWVIPRDQVWPWVEKKAQSYAERRGVFVVDASIDESPYAGWQCPHDPKCLHPTRCAFLVSVEAEKAKAAV